MNGHRIEFVSWLFLSPCSFRPRISFADPLHATWQKHEIPRLVVVFQSQMRDQFFAPQMA